MRRRIKTLNIIAGILLIFQFFAYLGSISSKPEDESGIGLVAYYFGFNMMLIIAFILLIISHSLKRKLQKEEQADEIDSIGKTE